LQIKYFNKIYTNCDQFKYPWFHSKITPKIRIKIKKFIELVIHHENFVIIIRGIGRIRVISTSKIKNKTARRKNWIEKGARADFFGLNPHSNGDIFSWSEEDFLKIIEEITGRIREIKRIKKKLNKKEKIIFY